MIQLPVRNYFHIEQPGKHECLMHECENVHLGLYAHLWPQTSDQNNKILDTGSGNELPL